MTKQELANYLQISENSISKDFPKIQKKYKDKGIEILKFGRGQRAEYFINKINKQPLTLYNSQSVIYLSDELIAIPEFAFLTAIALTLEKDTLNHKSYKDFLLFLEMDLTYQNLKLLKNSLVYLDAKGFITYKQDTSNRNYFLASWSIELKKQYKTQIKLLQEIKKLINKEKKSDKYIIYALKTLVGIKILSGKIITKAEFCNRFNLSIYQFDECTKILIKHN